MYTTDYGRNFYTLKEKQPNENDKIIIHTKDDEVINVECYLTHSGWYFETLDFVGSIDEYEIKGWNYPNCL